MNRPGRPPLNYIPSEMYEIRCDIMPRLLSVLGDSPWEGQRSLSGQPPSVLESHVGTIPESFRRQDGALRSSHPQVSFVARGRNAEFVTSNHSLNSLSEKSLPSLGSMTSMGMSYCWG